MKLTRRNILKALGIGVAVSVSGASIAKETNSWNVPNGQMFTDTSSGKITYSPPVMKIVAGPGIQVNTTSNTITITKVI